MANLHYIDTMRRSRGNFNKFTAYFIAGSFELVPFNGSHNITLNTTHSHSECEQLHSEGLTSTTGATHSQVCIFVFLRIKKIDNAKRIVMPIDSK